MSTTVVPPVETSLDDYIASRNAAEQRALAIREGRLKPELESPKDPAKVEEKPVETKAEEKTDEPKPVEKHRGDKGDLKRRGLVRALRLESQRLGEEKARREMAEERLAAFESKSKGGDPAPEEKVAAEPKRADFQTEEEFLRAYSAYSVDSKLKPIQTKLDEKRKQREMEAHLELVRRCDEKSSEDRELFNDFDEVSKSKNAQNLKYMPGSVFEMLILRSDQRAKILYHCAKEEPEELQRIADMKDGSPEQIDAFKRLEAYIKGVYRGLRKQPKLEKAKEPEPTPEPPKPVAPPKPTSAELDAKKAAPTESIAVRSGSGTAPTTPPPFLSDGKTVNPAWLAYRNETARK